MKFSSIILAAFLLFSCNNTSDSKKESKAITTPKDRCYLYSFNNDSVKLKLIESSRGKLEYLPFEKDGVIGDLYDLKTSGDTLFGMYKSTQEGIESICEIAMLKLGKSYILTDDFFGGDNYKFDSTYTYGKFIDKSRINFNGDTLLETNCME